jgi:tellurite resistance protein
MDFLKLSAEQVQVALRAMKSVAMADGVLDPREVSLLTACGSALGVEVDPLGLADIAPEAAREAATTAEQRERLVQALIIMSIMDGEAAPAEVALVERFARVLGVDEPRVQSLRQVATHHHLMLWMDLARRSWAKDVFAETLRQEGPRGIWKIVGPMLGQARDGALADRYVELGRRKEGTLGRAYFDFIRANDFGFPGEPGGLPERGVWHDMTHVIGGYTTDAHGEAEVTAFIGGYRREDPFFWLFTDIVHFHLHIKVTPYAKAETGMFEPGPVLKAMQRGMGMTRDLSDHWNWQELLGADLEALRAEYSVAPA